MGISFFPTFKVKRGVPAYGMPPHYLAQRSPAWCDRVLWLTKCQEQITYVKNSYRAHPMVSTSDHNPVSCCFDVSIDDAVVVKFTELKGKDLKACDFRVGRKDTSDPYIIFARTNRQKRDYRTNIIYKNCKNPEWRCDRKDQVPEIILKKWRNSKKQFLELQIYDWDRAKKDDFMGFASIPLIENCQESGRITFQEKVRVG